MIAPLPFGLGLIEGFYGRVWSDADRLDALRFVGSIGYRYYVHAPKADRSLRSCWSQRWSKLEEQRIRAIAECCEANSIDWGVGLSPLGLAESATRENRQRLREKIRYLDQFAPQILCLLFDDMPRTIDDLAALQVELVEEVRQVTRAQYLLVCPSYYSTDPVLEKLFGARPQDYWSTLGQRLPAQVGLFWTGEKVCSPGYDAQSLERIGAQLCRAPVLWDNYPVNDGARASKFLHLDAFRNRPAALAQHTAAHFVNPMNQCWLSRIPLATLPIAYREGAVYDPQRVLREVSTALCGEQLSACLLEDLPLLQTVGLEGLDAQQRERLLRRYGKFSSPYASELLDWLHGGYAFDPACLTD